MTSIWLGSTYCSLLKTQQFLKLGEIAMKNNSSKIIKIT